MLPPLEQVYADEPIETETPAPIDVESALTLDDTEVAFAPPVEITETVSAEISESEEALEDLSSSTEELLLTETQDVVIDEGIETPVIEEEVLDNETEASTTDEEVPPTPTEEDILENPQEEVVDDSPVEETETVIEQVASPSEAEPATTTLEETTPAPEEVHVNDSNRFQFSVDECVGVGDGAFYCSAPQSTTTNEATDAVFAATDADGDMEIFVRVGGEEVQITNNAFDDAAPYYAVEENRVVWHSLIGDRYQIMSYDIDTNRTLQLTESPFNNMEPIMVGDQILWQAWIGNNWEIVIYDGAEIRQLTNNEVHDVSPSIKDEYVMWQTQFTDGWKVSVYNLKTEALDVVDVEHLSGALENPRLVLLLDHVDAQGVRQMVGYDLETKKPVDLTTIPAPLPDELPEPDQTGEERAFVQNKPSLKESDDVSDTDDEVGGQTNNPMPDLSTAAGTTPTLVASSTDLVIPPYIATSSVPLLTDTETPVPVVLPADVVIPPFSSSTEVTVE